MERKCIKCGTKENLEEHHIVPKFLGGTDRDGRIIVCREHHTGKDGIHAAQVEALLKSYFEWVKGEQK